MFVLVAIVTLCILFLVSSWIRPRPPSPPLYPRALPLIGHAHLLIGDRKHLWQMIKSVYHFSSENGGVIEFKFSLHTVYVLTDPEDSLTLANTCFGKPYLYDFGKAFFNNGLVTSKVHIWKPHRKLLNPTFNIQALNTFQSEINLQAKVLVSELASEVGKERFDVRPYLVNFLLKVISRTSLGLEIGDQTLLDKDYAETIENLFRLYVERAQKIWLHLSLLYKWSALKRKEEKLIENLNDIINPIISTREFDLKKNQITNRNNGSTSENFTSIMDQVLNLVEKQNAFTKDEVLQHMQTFVAAAYDTTASTLKYILLVLGSYTDVQQRVFNELQEVFGQGDANCTKDDLPKLVYLDAVIKETMRVYPAVSFMARNVHANVKLKNYTLRAGSSCIIGLYAINRHPVWGADAEQFRPERWLDPATLPDNPHAFAPFGIGKRNCIGKLYGMITVKTALVHIIRQYHITSDISNLESQIDVIMQAVEGDLISLTLRK